MRKVTIITGHYGSGKSNISTNLAMEAAAQGKKVTVVDLDIVNPYFRTADFAKMFSENGIELITPSYANTNLDIPALNFDIERIANSDGYLIVDVGGDDDGNKGKLTLKGTISLNNVDVMTVGGRSGMLVGINDTATIDASAATIKLDDACSYGIYECEQNKGVFDGENLGLRDGILYSYVTRYDDTAKDYINELDKKPYVANALVMVRDASNNFVVDTTTFAGKVQGWN